MFIKTKSSLY